MAVLDISEEKFAIGVDTPLPTATLFIFGDNEGETELTANECVRFAHGLLRAASILEPSLIGYNVKQFIDSEL